MGEVDNLVVDGQLLGAVGDDEDADGSGTTSKGLLQARPEVALVDNLETLLDLAGLSHGNKLTVIADINEAVLLEDGAEQRVENHRGRGVRDDARLLVKLLGEQVNTEVTVLAGLGRGGDADDLARAVLEDDKISNADVVAGDSEGGCLRRVNRGDVGVSARVVSLNLLLVDDVANGLVVTVVVLGPGTGARSLVITTVVVVLSHFG